MPIYEFRCASCEHLFEEIVPAGTGEAACPRCNTAGASRQLSAFAAPAKAMGPVSKAPSAPKPSGGCGGGCGCGC